MTNVITPPDLHDIGDTIRQQAAVGMKRFDELAHPARTRARAQRRRKMGLVMIIAIIGAAFAVYKSMRGDSTTNAAQQPDADLRRAAA